MEKITSLENGKVKYWTKLKDKKYRDEEGLFIVEGDHLVLEAYKNNVIKEVILQDGIDNNLTHPVYYVTKDILKKISTMESFPTVMAVCYKKEEQTIGNKLLLLDNLQDPGNLGAIIRSAVAFNFDTIVLGDGCVDLYNDKVIRATEGMIFNISIVKRNLHELIGALQNDNYTIYGTDLNGINVKEIKPSDKFGVIIGNEGSGIDESLLNMCDKNIYIPINETCESLNASVAASIIMYELGDK